MFTPYTQMINKDYGLYVPSTDSSYNMNNDVINSPLYSTYNPLVSTTPGNSMSQQVANYCQQSPMKQPRSYKLPMPEMTVSLISDASQKIIYLLNKNGTLLPFMNGYVSSAEIIHYSKQFDKADLYKFLVKSNYFKDTYVSLTEDQFKTPEEIITQFQLQAHVNIKCNASDKTCGELFKRMLSDMLNGAPIIYKEYEHDPIVTAKKLQDMIMRHKEDTSTNLISTSDNPALACKGFLLSLLMLKEPIQHIFMVAIPIVTLLKPYFGNYSEQPKILVVEGDSTKRIQIVQHFLQVFNKDKNKIVSIDDSKAVEAALVYTHHDIIVISDGTMDRNRRQSMYRKDNLERIIDIHQGGLPIQKELKTSGNLFQKDLNAFITIVSNFLSYEGFNTSAFMPIEINESDIDYKQYYKLIKDKFTVSTLHKHFINYCASFYEEMPRFLQNNLNEIIQCNEVLCSDSLFTYALMVSSLDWFSRFTLSCGINLESYLGDYRNTLEAYFQDYDNIGLHGHGVLFHRILMKMCNEGKAKMIPLDQLGSYEGEALAIFYDNKYIYFREKELSNKLDQVLPSHIKVKHILEDLKVKGLLISYDESNYFTVKVTIPDGSGVRKHVVQIKIEFMDNELSGLF